jgi:hypothetical protein
LGRFARPCTCGRLARPRAHQPRACHARPTRRRSPPHLSRSCPTMQAVR